MVCITLENFNLKQIADSGQCFRMKEIDTNTYCLVALGRYLEIKQDGSNIYFCCSEEDYQNIWRNYFDIDRDYSILSSIIAEDEYLIKSYESGSGIRILQQDLFETTISFIISQQKSIPCIQNCVERISKAFGKEIQGESFKGGKIKAYAFPSSERMKDASLQDLKEFGLGYRDEYIYDAIQWFIHSLPNMDLTCLRSNYNFAFQILKGIKGVGDKVANCICLFSLHQLNACPIDVHMQRIIDSEYQGIKPKWMNSPYAGVLQQYCFYYRRIHQN